MPVTLESWNPAKLEPKSFPQDARIDAAMLGPSLTLAKGTVLGKKTADDKLYAYATGAADGTETAVAILVHDVKTDANGKHYLGTDAVASSINVPKDTIAVYVAGVFDTDELTGYDAAALADMNGRLLPSGFIRIP